MKSNVIGILLLLLSFPLASEILVESGGFTITSEEFNAVWESIPLEVRDYYQQKNDAKQEFLMDLLRQRVFAEAAREMRLHEDPACKSQMEIATNQVLAQNYIDRTIRYPILTPEALQKKYDSIKSEFTRQGWYEAGHILVTPRPTPGLNNNAGDDAVTGKQARTKAEKILALLNNGAPFEQVARQFSEDPKTTLVGGDLGHFSPGTMVKEVEAALDLRSQALPPVGQIRLLEARAGAQGQEVDEAGQRALPPADLLQELLHRGWIAQIRRVQALAQLADVVVLPHQCHPPSASLQFLGHRLGDSPLVIRNEE